MVQNLKPWRKKRKNSRNKVTQDLCLTIRPKLSKLVASQLKVETMQMLIKSCEKLWEFFETNLKYQSALCIDHSIVTDPMIANLKEGLTLVLHYVGLIWLQVYKLISPKPHDNIQKILVVLNNNLDKLLSRLNQKNIFQQK